MKLIYVGPGKYWYGRPCPGSIPGAKHLFRYVTNQLPKANSAFHPSGVGKWVPALAGKAKAGMVHSVNGWMRGVQVKLWDPLRTHAIPECLRDVFMTRCCINLHLLFTLPFKKAKVGSVDENNYVANSCDAGLNIRNQNTNRHLLFSVR